MWSGFRVYIKTGEGLYQDRLRAVRETGKNSMQVATGIVTVSGINYIVTTPGILSGSPHIAGHRIGVHHIANLYARLGVGIEEIAQSYDLAPAQIHAALAYYYGHQEEIDQLIDENDRLAARHTDDEQQTARRAEVEARAAVRQQEMTVEMTVTEIVQAYSVSAQAVRKACDEGWIPARKSGATWLIRRSDAEKRWGK